MLALDNPEKFVASGPAVEWMMWCMGEGKPPKEELLWEGGAGLGKSRSAWEGLIQLADRCADLRVAVVRRTRKSMTQSTLALLENQVLGPNHPIIASKGSRSHWTDLRWPTGAEFAFECLEDPTRLFSTEWHIIWVNEAQEMKLSQWMSLHRGLRAPGGPGWRLLLGDYNPPHEAHWICHRGEANRATGAPSPALQRFWRHDHNPVLFDPVTQDWTERGIEYLSRLRRTMSGPTLRSLLFGERTTSEGLIWPQYDPRKHRVTGKMEKDGEHWYLHIPEWEDGSFGGSPVRIEWFLGALDFGYRAPGCLQIWGFDKAHRMFRVAEIYRHGEDIDWWADWAARLYEQYRYTVGVADHNPSEISILNKRVGPMFNRGGLGIWRPWDKTKTADAERAGIQQMRVRWKQDSAFLVRDAFPAGMDPLLQETGHPVSLEEEIGQYVYSIETEGKIVSPNRRELPDPAAADHAADAARGAAAYAFLKDFTPLAADRTGITAAPGSVEYQYQKLELERERQFASSRQRNQW